MQELTFTKKDKDIFHHLYFALSARAKCVTRPTFQLLEVKNVGENMRITCVDGFRIHTSELPDNNHGIECGFYDVVKHTKTKIIIKKTNEDLIFPDLQRVIPTYRESDLVEISNENDRYSSDVAVSVSLIGFYAAQRDVLLNYSYIADSINSASHIKVCVADGLHSPFIIHHDLGRAYIMPIHLDNERLKRS